MSPKKKDPIHIDPENKGKFTALAKKHGMEVDEFAHKVLGSNSKSPAHVRKMAQFALNAKDWNHKGGSKKKSKKESE
jgi:hypothetical protein